jgi:hypothetical protein
MSLAVEQHTTAHRWRNSSGGHTPINSLVTLKAKFTTIHSLILLRRPNVTLALTDFFVDWSSFEKLNLLQGENKNTQYITKTRTINVVFRMQRHFLDIM